MNLNFFSVFFSTILGLSLMCCLPCPAFDLEGANAETKSLPDDSSSNPKWSTFLGRDVETKEGKGLGKVTELALDMKNGRILAVIVTQEGFLGLGKKRSVGVPPGAFANFKDGHEDGMLYLNLTWERFQAAPELKASGWGDYFQSRRVADLFQYFEVQPYFTGSKTERGGETAQMSLGPVKKTGEVIGLPVRDAHSMLGKVMAIRVDAETERVMYVLASGSPLLDSQSDIMASEVQMNATQDELWFDVSKQAGSRFRQPAAGR